MFKLKYYFRLTDNNEENTIHQYRHIGSEIKPLFKNGQVVTGEVGR
jgi:hypothetical protein